MSEDPLGFGAGDANLYRYVGNDPTNGTDPTGLLAWVYDTDKKTLTLNVTLRFTFQNTPQSTWTVLREAAFVSSALWDINTAWNDAPYRIYPATRKLPWSAQHAFLSSPQPAAYPIYRGGWKPEVNVTATTGWADYAITVYAHPDKTPDGRPFRGPHVNSEGVPVPTSSYLGGTTFGSAGEWQEDDVKETPHGTKKVGYFHQIAVVHEFGHLLDNDHPGATLYRSLTGQSNDDADYEADAPALMGFGMALRPEYFHWWREKLDSDYWAFGPHTIR